MRIYVNTRESINISLNEHTFGLNILMAHRMLKKITRAYMTEQVIYMILNLCFVLLT